MYIKEIGTNQWVGIEPHSEKTRVLRAGNLALDYLNGRITNISYKGRVLVSEVYFALRDDNWGTVPFKVQNLLITETENSFEIRFSAINDQDNIKFSWTGKIEGTAQSSITYQFDGLAQSDFLKNRIGFCVLHPSSCGGMACKVEHSEGKIEDGIMPEQIAPHQPFFDIKAITVYSDESLGIEVRFDGDVFEMEDQRNWTDASFKTYCTPLSLHFPVPVKTGDTFSQKIKISLLKDSYEGNELVAPEQELDALNDEFFESRLSLGSCITKPLTQIQLHRVKELKLSHLRYDYRFCEHREDLGKLAAQARLLDVKLLIAVFFTDNIAEELPYFRNELENIKDDLCCVLVYMQDVKVLPSELLVKARAELRDINVPIGSGTDAFFTQLNREPLYESIMDFVSYSNNPQVHAFDNQSIMSTTEGQLANIKSCRILYPNIPICISPITMKMRWNPDATAKAVLQNGQIPKDVEPRQMSLFVACWFLKSIATLLKSREVSMATYFELVGKKGIMEDELPTEPYSFPTAPGMLYPLYFAYWGLRGLQHSAASVDIKKETVAIRLRQGHKTRVVICNTTDSTVPFNLRDFSNTAECLVLDEDNIRDAVLDPIGFLSGNCIKYLNQNGEILLKRYSIFIAEI